MEARRVHVTESELHAHLKARMEQRGITFDEIQQTLDGGSAATAALPGTAGKVKVFPSEREWEGRFHLEKEVSVYYKHVAGSLILITKVS
jgi:hypothetical protein